MDQIQAGSKATQTLPRAQPLFVFLQQEYLDLWKYWHLPFSSLHPFLLGALSAFLVHDLAELLQPPDMPESSLGEEKGSSDRVSGVQKAQINTLGWFQGCSLSVTQAGVVQHNTETQ